jgi:hypothetical protein
VTKPPLNHEPLTNRPLKPLFQQSRRLPQAYPPTTLTWSTLAGTEPPLARTLISAITEAALRKMIVEFFGEVEEVVSSLTIRGEEEEGDGAPEE